MPTIARVDGAAIRIFPREHGPPHFHVIAADRKAVILIADLHVVYSNLPTRLLRLVLDWARSNQPSLALQWIKITGEE